MELSENLSRHPNLIQTADHKQCLIGSTTHTEGIVIPFANAIETHGLASVHDLSEMHIQQLCQHKPELVILATGQLITYPDPQILNPLLDHQIGLEVLSNAAAARTFNVLLAEDRRVVCMMFFDH